MCALCEAFLKKLIIRFCKLSGQQAYDLWSHCIIFASYAFCNFVDSKHSICLYTTLFSKKIRVPTNTKNLLGEPKPLDRKSRFCSIERQMKKIFTEKFSLSRKRNNDYDTIIITGCFEIFQKKEGCNNGWKMNQSSVFSLRLF